MHILLIVPDSTPTRTIASRILDILSFYDFIGLCFRQGYQKTSNYPAIVSDWRTITTIHSFVATVLYQHIQSADPILFLKYLDIEQA